MRPMLRQRQLELYEQMLGHLSRMSPVLEPGDKLLLARHVALALGDVALSHAKVG